MPAKCSYSRCLHSHEGSQIGCIHACTDVLLPRSSTVCQTNTSTQPPTRVKRGAWQGWRRPGPPPLLPRRPAGAGTRRGRVGPRAPAPTRSPSSAGASATSRHQHFLSLSEFVAVLRNMFLSAFLMGNLKLLAL